MSIESEINRINTNVQNTLAAIEEMGGEVPEDGNSDDMAGGVRTIPVGAKIDDTTPSTTTTYSSEKIEASLNELKEKNDAQDEALAQLKEAIDEELDSLDEQNAQQDEAIAKKLNASELPTAINTALEQAKESGQFDGKDGAPGADGKDYVLTEADKEEIAEMAAEKIEVPEGGGGTSGAESTNEQLTTIEEDVASYEFSNLSAKKFILKIVLYGTTQNEKAQNGYVGITFSDGRTMNFSNITGSFSTTSSKVWNSPFMYFMPVSEQFAFLIKSHETASADFTTLLMSPANATMISTPIPTNGARITSVKVGSYGLMGAGTQIRLITVS